MVSTASSRQRPSTDVSSGADRPPQGIRKRRPPRRNEYQEPTDNRVSSNKQKAMLRQIADYELTEKQEMANLQALHQNALSDLMWSYLRMIGLLMIILVGLLWYTKPNFLLQKIPFFKEKLPPRHVAVLYPYNFSLRSHLPALPFSPNLSVKNSTNTQQQSAIQDLQMVHQIMRRFIADILPRLNYRQAILVHGWEHGDFQRQLPNDYMDLQCGNGFRQVYNKVTANDNISYGKAVLNKDFLVLWCMMASGTQDGYVRWGVNLKGSLTRGYQGVAVQYQTANGPQPRIHLSSFFFLPLPNKKEGPPPMARIVLEQQQQQQRRQGFGGETTANGNATDRIRNHHPTEIGQSVKDWLLTHGGIENSDQLQELEEFVYQRIVESGYDFHFFQAICNDATTQSEWDGQYRCVATVCTPWPKEYHHQEQGDNCCSIYDPTIPVYQHHPDAVRRRRQTSSGSSDSKD